MPQTLKIKLIFFTAALVLSLTVPVPGSYALEGAPPVYVQGLVGAAQFDGDSLNFQTASSDTTTGSDNDLSSLPYAGLAVQYPFSRGNTQWGLDASLLFGWRTQNKSVVITNNRAVVTFDTELWLTDFAFGLYIAHSSQNWRSYIAAGPAMLYGTYDETDDPTATPYPDTVSANSETASGVGAYVRGGIEYILGPQGGVGFGVRVLQTNLQFDNAAATSSDLSGVQGFMTFSKYF